MRKTVVLVAFSLGTLIAALFLTRAPMVRATAAPTDGHHTRVFLESSYVLSGSGETHLAVVVTGPTSSKQAARPNMDIAIVLDRSGSMHGEKLEEAKRAAAKLVQRLEARDRFSIVVYGSEVDVAFESHKATDRNKKKALAAIEKIYDAGGTNMSGGIIAGREALIGSPLSTRERSTGYVRRIVLISDGEANEGLSQPHQLVALATETADLGVSITTVGVGLDFDEQTLTNIAVSGRGQYYFAEDATMLADKFETELSRVGAMAATEVSVTFTAASGVEVLEAYGYQMFRDGDAVTVRLSDLSAGESRKVVLRLGVNTSATTTAELGTVATSFLGVESGKLHTDRVAVSAQVTDDPALFTQNLNGDAAVLVEKVLNARAINRAAELHRSGDIDGASQVLREQRAATGQRLMLVAPEAAAEIGAINEKAEQGFRGAKGASSPAGKRARKANRAEAYDLAY